jgi:hypothetical protein
MKLRTSIQFLCLALGLVVFLSACKPGRTPEEIFTGSWKLKSLNVKDQDPPPPNIMAQASFNFYADGRYEILLGELDKGKWSLSADKKMLITHTTGNPAAQEIDISSVSEDEIVLVNKLAPSPVTMTLVRDK